MSDTLATAEGKKKLFNKMEKFGSKAEDLLPAQRATAITGYDLRARIEALIAGITGKTIKTTYYGTGAATAEGMMILPTIPQALLFTREEAQVLLGYTAHEISHQLETDFTILKRIFVDIKKPTLRERQLKEWWNAIEDYRIEKLTRIAFPGFPIYIGATRHYTAQRFVDAVESGNVIPGALGNPYRIGAVGLTWVGAILNGYPTQANDKALSLLDDDLEAWLRGNSDRLSKVMTQDDALQLASDLLDELDQNNDQDDDDQDNDDQGQDKSDSSQQKSQKKDSDKDNSSQSDSDDNDSGDDSQDQSQDGGNEDNQPSDGDDAAENEDSSSEENSSEDGSSNNETTSEEDASGGDDDDASDQEAKGEAEGEDESDSGQNGESSDEDGGESASSENGGDNDHDSNDASGDDQSDSESSSNESESTGDAEGDSGSDDSNADSDSNQNSSEGADSDESTDTDSTSQDDGGQDSQSANADNDADGNASSQASNGQSSSDQQASDASQDANSQSSQGDESGGEDDSPSSDDDSNSNSNASHSSVGGNDAPAPKTTADQAEEEAEESDLTLDDILEALAQIADEYDNVPVDIDGEVAGSEREQVQRAQRQYSDLKRNIGSSAARTAGVVRRLLASKNQTRTRRNLEQGKLDLKRLVPIASGSPNVYYERSNRKDVNSAVSILVDNSISMRGNPIEVCQKAAIVLDSAISGTGTDLEITGFTGSDCNPVIYQYRRFGQRSQAAAASLGAMTDVSMGGTPVSVPILEAHRHLMAHKAPRKIMIIISDGAASDPQRAKEAHDVAVATGCIVFGIGIGPQGMAIGHWCANCQVIQDIEELPTALSTIVQHAMTNKMRKAA